VQASHAAREAERARAATEFVAELFRLNAGGAGVGSAAPAPTEFIDRGAALIQARFAGQPEMQAQLLGAVGQAYDDMGANALAIDYANRRLQVLQKLPESSALQVQTLLLAASAYLHDDNPEASEAAARRAVETSGSEPALILDSLASLARAQMEGGHVDAARLTIQRGQDVLRTTPSLDRIASATRLACSEAMMLMLDGRFEQSKPMVARVVAQALQSEGPGSRTAEELLFASALAVQRIDMFDEARTQFEQAMAIVRQRGGPLSRIKESMSTAVFWSAAADWSQIPVPAALSKLQTSHDMLNALGRDLPPIARAKVDLQIALLYLRWTDVQRAAEWIKPSTEVLLASNPSLRTRSTVLRALSMFNRSIGDDETALHETEENLRIVQQLSGPNGPNMFWADTDLVDSLVDAGKFDEARRLLDNEASSRFASARSDLATSTMIRLKLEIAIGQGDTVRAAAQVPNLDSMTLRNRLNVLHDYGYVVCQAGDPVRGVALLQESIRGELDRGVFKYDPDLSLIRGRTGICALAAGRRALAEACASEVRRAFAAEPLIGPHFREPLLQLERTLNVKPGRNTVPDLRPRSAAIDDNQC
jgi:tetratricopeptide (TPR) repeat protein